MRKQTRLNFDSTAHPPERLRVGIRLSSAGYPATVLVDAVWRMRIPITLGGGRRDGGQLVFLVDELGRVVGIISFINGVRLVDEGLRVPAPDQRLQPTRRDHAPC